MCSHTPPTATGDNQEQPQTQLHEECPICLEDLKPRSGLAILNCGTCTARFHLNCLKKNSAKSDQCPVCRQRINGEEGVSYVPSKQVRDRMYWGGKFKFGVGVVWLF